MNNLDKKLYIRKRLQNGASVFWMIRSIQMHSIMQVKNPLQKCLPYLELVAVIYKERQHKKRFCLPPYNSGLCPSAKETIINFRRANFKDYYLPVKMHYLKWHISPQK